MVYHATEIHQKDGKGCAMAYVHSSMSVRMCRKKNEPIQLARSVRHCDVALWRKVILKQDSGEKWKQRNEHNGLHTTEVHKSKPIRPFSDLDGQSKTLSETIDYLPV